MIQGRLQIYMLAAVILLAGWIAYANSFSSAFVFDDHATVIHNPYIQDWQPIGKAFEPISSRSVVYFTLALNYAVSGLEPWSYHVLNFFIHVLSSLFLFGLLRRTFLTERLQTRYGPAATALSFSIALIWMLHPIQTQSVTYVSQRAESLMGMFYLATLYTLCRGAMSTRSTLWILLSLGCCLLGIGTKEVMVTAPVIAFLYDRIFLADSVGKMFEKRGWYYAGLILSWIPLAVLVKCTAESSLADTAGFGYDKVTAFEYARTQPEVILHYLKLSFVPHPLIIDYQWPVADTLPRILLPLAGILTLLAGTLVLLKNIPPLGFLGVWFFLILVPTSSVMPIADLAFEHRMYLSLAAVVTVTTVGCFELVAFLSHQAILNPRYRKGIFVIAGLTVAALFCFLTIQRNRAYASEMSLWADTLIKQPRNARALTNLGRIYADDGDLKTAILFHQKALIVDPEYQSAHYNIANAYTKEGNLTAAASHYEKALKIDPEFVEAYTNLGNVLSRIGKNQEAADAYQKALDLDWEFAYAHYNYANSLVKLDQAEKAVRHYEEALRINPEHIKQMLEVNPGYAESLQELRNRRGIS